MAKVTTGHMGKAILKGLLRDSKTSVLRNCRFEASVARNVSSQRLQQDFAPFVDRIQIHCDNNLRVARDADVILLSFPPNQLASILGGPGMGEALEGKLIISILAGIGRAQIEDQLSKSSRNKGTFDRSKT